MGGAVLETEDKRLAELEADIRIRLADVCGHMRQEEFAELVRDIARNAQRAEQRTNRSWSSLRRRTGTESGLE
jgi:hypothetical protein